MKFAKGFGGLLGIFEQHGAYQRWCRTTSVRVEMFEKTSEMCGLSTNPNAPREGKHRYLHYANIKKSEIAVEHTNPWRIPDKTKLYSRSSGYPMTQLIEK